ncbi:DNA ligase 1-like, partial [Trifolium medium]|nr:DNA ligase 1-like [Trifolium medium]
MDGFVLPSFESTCILKDKDIVCVKRKGSSLTDGKSAMLLSDTHENQSIEGPKLLAIEGFQEEKGEYESLSEDDDGDNDQSEDVVNVETK